MKLKLFKVFLDGGQPGFLNLFDINSGLNKQIYDFFKCFCRFLCNMLRYRIPS